MQKLVDGVHAFQAEYFTSHRELFRQLAIAGQRPETLFITCSDARVVPNLITNAGPGELFIVRNVGNMVPDAGLPGGTAAAIEFAVQFLEVEQIVVCGHTHCGAIRAVLEPSTMESMPFVKKWLAQAGRVRQIVGERYADLPEEERVAAAVEENVLVQIENLRAFPFVAERLEKGTLHVNGWVFKIETGQVFDYDPGVGQFTELRPGSVPPPPARVEAAK
jgi:carbonic anhydrase